MANPVLKALEDQVKATTDVQASAKLLIDGFRDRTQAAVDQALANGATEQELAPVQDLVNELDASSDALSESILANTPSAGQAKKKP